MVVDFLETSHILAFLLDCPVLAGPSPPLLLSPDSIPRLPAPLAHCSPHPPRAHRLFSALCPCSRPSLCRGCVAFAPFLVLHMERTHTPHSHPNPVLPCSLVCDFLEIPLAWVASDLFAGLSLPGLAQRRSRSEAYHLPLWLGVWAMVCA